MRFVMFIVDDPDHTAADAAQAPSVDEWFAEVRRRRNFVQGVRLEPAANGTTVRVRGGQTTATVGHLTPGLPSVLGFAILECDTMEQAIEIAAANNMAHEGRIELREIHSMGDPELPQS